MTITPWLTKTSEEADKVENMYFVNLKTIFSFEIETLREPVFTLSKTYEYF